jgi:hypothetical protein
LPYNGIEEMWKYSKPDIRIEQGRNRVVSYIELPLWVNNDSNLLKCDNREELNRTQNLKLEYFATRPKIKIKEIKFGVNCGIQSIEFDTFRKMVSEIFELNYGYKIHIDYTLFDFRN